MTVRHLTDITNDEVRLLCAAAASIDIDEAEGEAIYLRNLDGGHQWIVEAPTGQVFIPIHDPARKADDEGWLAISERVRRFAESYPDDKVSLSIADDRTIVASAGSVTAAIDLVPQRRDDPEPWTVNQSAVAVVPCRQFLTMLWSARCLPSGIGELRYPTPPMWMQFGDGWVGLHVDWTDFLPSRSTHRIATLTQDGHTTTSIPHSLIESFLRTVPVLDADGNELELKITVGTIRQRGIDRDAIALEAAEWRLILWLTHPLTTRWADTINEELEKAGFAVVDSDGVEWILATSGPEVRVKLHHGHPDIARVSAPLVAPVEENLELLRELNALNASSTGVRYWLEDTVVRVASDLRCTSLAMLPGVINDITQAAITYAPMIAALGVGA